MRLPRRFWRAHPGNVREPKYLLGTADEHIAVAGDKVPRLDF
jgi:hypothetical protein